MIENLKYCDFDEMRLNPPSLVVYVLFSSRLDVPF